MQIVFLRSSALSSLEYCEQSYFMTYNLGFQQDSNIKAEYGTIVHKVMEILALMKLAQQNGEKEIDDDCIGKVTIDDNFVKPTILKPNEVDDINLSRAAKSFYISDCFVDNNHVRLGVDLIEDLFDRVYNYYVNISKHKWEKADRRRCHNLTWMVLEYTNGLYDPRKKKIFQPEHKFSFEIKKDWAQYEYKLADGTKIEGHLGLKGTIDLITDEGLFYEVTDYKTGKRYNWATGKEKTFKKLMEDDQLLFYYYALKNLYPKLDIMFTIFFVRDGGPFSFSLEDDMYEAVEKKLRKKFEYIRDSKIPKLLDYKHKDFRCNKLCHFYKNKLVDGKMVPRSKYDSDDSACDFIHKELKKFGMDYVIENYSESKHELGYYASPGGK